MNVTDWFPHSSIALGFVNAKTGEIAALYPHGGWYVAPKCPKEGQDKLEAYLRAAPVSGFPKPDLAAPHVQDVSGRVLGTVDSLSIHLGESSHLALIPQALRDIAANLASQDSRATNNPQFLVQKKVRQTGLDADYCDDVIWLDCGNDHKEVTDPDEIAKLDELDSEYFPTAEQKAILSDYIKTGYVDRWETVQPFFTEVEADRYITTNKHRHDEELRTYVDWGGRNPEWMTIRNFLLSLNPPKASSAPTTPQPHHDPHYSSPAQPSGIPRGNRHSRRNLRDLR